MRIFNLRKVKVFNSSSNFMTFTNTIGYQFKIFYVSRITIETILNEMSINMELRIDLLSYNIHNTKSLLLNNLNAKRYKLLSEF